MEAQDIIALTLVGASVVYLVRTFRRQMQGRSGCGCAHAKKGNQRGALQRLPLVTPESVGRPFPTDEHGSTATERRPNTPLADTPQSVLKNSLSEPRS